MCVLQTTKPINSRNSYFLKALDNFLSQAAGVSHNKNVIIVLLGDFNDRCTNYNIFTTCIFYIFLWQIFITIFNILSSSQLFIVATHIF